MRKREENFLETRRKWQKDDKNFRTGGEEKAKVAETIELNLNLSTRSCLVIERH